MTLLRDKVAWVTGSSRGIGAAIAKQFAERGAKVVLHGRDAAALAGVRSEIERAGGRAIEVKGDVTKFAEIEAMRREIEETMGPIDILVANAGGSFTPPGPIEETSEEGWRAAAKAGIELMTQDVAAQAGPYNVRVNCIAPETILTERNRQRIPAAQQQALAETHPLRRLGTPEDVARAAAFLASDDAGWITGVILDVAGGATMIR